MILVHHRAQEGQKKNVEQKEWDHIRVELDDEQDSIFSLWFSQFWIIWEILGFKAFNFVIDSSICELNIAKIQF